MKFEVAFDAEAGNVQQVLEAIAAMPLGIVNARVAGTDYDVAVFAQHLTARGEADSPAAEAPRPRAKKQ